MTSQCTPSSLPNTQDTVALTQSQDAASQQQTLAVWGRLYPLRENLKIIELVENVYTGGRSERCNIRFTLEQMKEKVLNTISKIHFCIYKECIDNTNETVIYLKDISRNGTFVNKEKVGHGNRIIIENSSVIALGSNRYEVYTFVSTIMPEINQLPPYMKRKYALGRRLGAGAYGEVRLVFTRDGSKRFAMKTIKKDNFSASAINPFNNPETIRNEVNILKRLSHSCIIQMEDICDTPTAMYIILELMEGGELFDRIKSRGRLSESCAKLIFYQVVLAVHYLHRQDITHRDLKPENILLASNSDITIAKVSDFGLSKLVDANSMRTFCGTPMYVAPEILMNCGNSSYTKQVDVWSLGVILYVCLSGIVPFNVHNKNHSLEYQIRSGVYNFPQSHFGHVSQDAIHLIICMMTVNPRKRITIPQILRHSWFNDSHMRETVNSLISPENDENMPSLNVYTNNNRLDQSPEAVKRARYV